MFEIRRAPLRDEAAEATAGPPEHPSLALAGLLGALTASAQPRVLDLGPAVGGNVNFFGGYSARLYIADVFRTLLSRRPQLGDNTRRLVDFFDQQLPGAESESFQLVLAWDLLDYLTDPELEAMGRSLASRMPPGALLYATVGTHAAVPASPLRYEIVDERTIRHLGGQPAERPAPRHKEPKLRALLPDFEVDTSYLLRHGAQEYVLVRTVPANDPVDVE